MTIITKFDPGDTVYFIHWDGTIIKSTIRYISGIDNGKVTYVTYRDYPEGAIGFSPIERDENTLFSSKEELIEHLKNTEIKE